MVKPLVLTVTFTALYRIYLVCYCYHFLVFNLVPTVEIFKCAKVIE